MLESSKAEYEYKPEGTYSIGDMIVVHLGSADVLSMIIQTDVGIVQVVSMETGNRFDKPLQVSDVTKIDSSTVFVLTHSCTFDRVKRATLSRGK